MLFFPSPPCPAQLAQKRFNEHTQALEDRANRRQMRDLRRQTETDVSDDSEEEDIDRYNGLSNEEKWNRMLNEARDQLREEEIKRLLTKEKKRQNVLQNKAMKQGQSAMLQVHKIQQEVVRKVDENVAFKKDLVIMDPLPCVHVTLEMCLIGYKEAMRFLSRSDIFQQFEKASLQQLRMSVDLVLQHRKSPVQVKLEMLWRFAVVTNDFLHGSRQREKYLLLSYYAYLLLQSQVNAERERRARVLETGTEEERERLAIQADWEVGRPPLFWELGALVNSMEMETDDEDSVRLHRRMEEINNASAFVVLRRRPQKVPVPEDVTPVE